jgi:hypothetical protein
VVSQSGVVNFGIPLKWRIPKRSRFTSTTQWIGRNERGTEVKSNVAETNFWVWIKGENTQIVQEVKAINTDNGVLGTTNNNVCIQITQMIPYVLLFIVSGFWLTKQTKKWLDILKKK